MDSRDRDKEVVRWRQVERDKQREGERETGRKRRTERGQDEYVYRGILTYKTVSLIFLSHEFHIRIVYAIPWDFSLNDGRI